MLSIALNPRIRFLQRTWDDECVVYVVDSGETHLLSSACAILLNRLAQGPATIDALSRMFQSLSDDLTDEEISGLLENVIDSVRGIGLVDTVESPS